MCYHRMPSLAWQEGGFVSTVINEKEVSHPRGLICKNNSNSFKIKPAWKGGKLYEDRFHPSRAMYRV